MSKGKTVGKIIAYVLVLLVVVGVIGVIVRFTGGFTSDFKTFYEEARRIITSIPEDGDPYGTDKEIAAQGDFDVILLSATPKLYFTSISYTQYAPGHPLDYPLMNAGKAVKREGRLVMPIALTVSHAFVDGAHISQFFEKVAQYLKER